MYKKELNQNAKINNLLTYLTYFKKKKIVTRYRKNKCFEFSFYGIGSKVMIFITKRLNNVLGI